MARHDDLIAALTASGWTKVRRIHNHRYGELAYLEREHGKPSLLMVPCDESFSHYESWMRAAVDELRMLADRDRQARQVLNAIGGG